MASEIGDALTETSLRLIQFRMLPKLIWLSSVLRDRLYTCCQSGFWSKTSKKVVTSSWRNGSCGTSNWKWNNSPLNEEQGIRAAHSEFNWKTETRTQWTCRVSLEVQVTQRSTDTITQHMHKLKRWKQHLRVSYSWAGHWTWSLTDSEVAVRNFNPLDDFEDDENWCYHCASPIDKLRPEMRKSIRNLLEMRRTAFPIGNWTRRNVDFIIYLKTPSHLNAVLQETWQSWRNKSAPTNTARHCRFWTGMLETRL